jgi:hypothetical protein
MSELEKYIRNHQGEFNSEEPIAGHFDRFEEMLTTLPKPGQKDQNRSLLLKIAALIIILITVSVVAFEFVTREISNRFAIEKEGTELPLEIREAFQYYDNQTSVQMATLSKLAQRREDALALNTSALNEIRSLDAITSDLKQSLSENPGNELILDAIVRNQQLKETMLNTMITQISQSGK